MSPGELDVRVVRRHLAALRAAIEVLKGHANEPLERLVSDPEERWTVERGLQLRAQNVLDIATHITACTGRDVPDYSSAIDALGALGVLPIAFAQQLRSVAGFRNVLVHGYLEVDLELLHGVLNERLQDFVVFAHQWRSTWCLDDRGSEATR